MKPPLTVGQLIEQLNLFPSDSPVEGLAFSKSMAWHAKEIWVQEDSYATDDDDESVVATIFFFQFQPTPAPRPSKAVTQTLLKSPTK